MTNRFFLFYICVGFVLFFASKAQAQSCTPTYELIFDMSDAKIGSYNIWDSVQGEVEFEEKFVSAVAAPEKSHHLAVGHRAFVSGGPLDLMLVELDHRGRKEWQKFHEVRGLNEVVKILSLSDGYLILANIKHVRKNGVIWLGFFDKKGELQSKKEIRDKKGHLRGYDIIQSKDGKEFLLAAGFEKPEEAQKRHSVLYRVSGKGDVVSKRAYVPGPLNGLLSLYLSNEGYYMATGYSYAAGDRKVGWMMRLNETGSIVWQRQYPRGRAAEILQVTDYNQRYLAVAGVAWPSGKGTSAGWVMMIDAGNGNIVWQRYYTGGYDYEGRGVQVSEDGLVSVLLNGKAPKDEDKKDYVSLLTINPRGDLLIRDAYYNAEGSHAHQVFYGPRSSRVLVGHTDRVYQIEGAEGEEPVTVRGIDGWVVAAASTEPYKDPCAQ